MFYTSIKNRVLIKIFVALFIANCLIANSFAINTIMKEDSLMVQKFYSTWHEPLFWLSSKKNIKKAQDWLKVMKSDKNSGYIPDEVQTQQIRTTLTNSKKMDNFMKEKPIRTSQLLYWISSNTSSREMFHLNMMK